MSAGGGGSTIRLAVAVFPVIPTDVPVPSSNVAVTLPEVLTCEPAATPLTSTENVHEPDMSRDNANMSMLLLPGFAVTAAALNTAPPSARQLPVSPLGEATTSPLGNVSLNAMLDKPTVVFGFVRVKVSDVVPPKGMLAAPKAFARLGGTTTVSVAVPAAPRVGALSVEVIGPVLFT